MTNSSGSKKVSSDIIALRKQVSDLKDAAIERRRVEAAVRAAGELYRETVDQAPVAILRLDRAGKVLLANFGFISLLGYASRQDFHTIGDLRGVFADDAECRRVVELAFSGGKRIDANCRVRDGSLRVIPFLSGSPDEGVTLVVDAPPA